MCKSVPFDRAQENLRWKVGVRSWSVRWLLVKDSDCNALPIRRWFILFSDWVIESEYQGQGCRWQYVNGATADYQSLLWSFSAYLMRQPQCKGCKSTLFFRVFAAWTRRAWCQGQLVWRLLVSQGSKLLIPACFRRTIRQTQCLFARTQWVSICCFWCGARLITG